MKTWILLIMITGGAYIMSLSPDKPAKKHHTCNQTCTKKKCDEGL